MHVLSILCLSHLGLAFWILLSGSQGLTAWMAREVWVARDVLAGIGRAPLGDSGREPSADEALHLRLPVPASLLVSR